LSTELEERHAEYAKLLEKLKLSNPEYASLIAVNPLTLAEVQKLLEGATLLEYFVTEEQTFVFVVGENDFQAQTLEVTREDLRRALTAFHDFASLEGTPDELAWLYTTLFAPVRPHIKTGVIIIAAHGPLHYLPFQALYDGQRYLVQGYAISYTPSASVLPFALDKRKAGASEGSALVMGNPDVPGVPRLAYAEGEAQAVADLYGTTAYSQGQATESLLRDQAGGAGLIHLACHGQYNPNAPLFSRLLLAGDAEHDGYLNVHEIYNIELPQADLVTLSACQTNVGQVSQGDEVVGLNRALIYAGSPTILASLWSVDDAATGELMLSFYKHLKEGKSKAEALRAAQVEMLGQEAYAHPYYWAPFVLTGDPGEITGEVVTNAATPVATATEAAAREPVPETPRRRLCAGVALPIGLMVLAGLRRKDSLQPRNSG